MEAILSGTITLEQRQQQPLAAALQQRQLLAPPSPPPPPQEQPLHDLLRDGYTISRRLCADIHHHRHCHPRDPPSFFSPAAAQTSAFLSYAKSTESWCATPIQPRKP